jgi:hypothetical protein
MAMASITRHDLDPSVIDVLEAAARRHGTTLEQEAHRLLVAASAQLHHQPAPASSFMERVARWRASVGPQALDDLADELEQARDRSLVRIPEEL